MLGLPAVIRRSRLGWGIGPGLIHVPADAGQEELGVVCRQGQWEYAYPRCRTCGFTVQEIVRYLPDPVEIATLQKLFATVFSR
ncbi:MAG TPA: hypothetical protein VLM91_02125 [Candidatus Methylomirabilis sp.]|nr:hypothetical protein [Candidatus Methylomirabilis sp.]